MSAPMKSSGVIMRAEGVCVCARVSVGVVGWLMVLCVFGVSVSWAGFGVTQFDGAVTDRAGGGFDQAGGHPFEAATTFELNRTVGVTGNVIPDGGQVKECLVDLPAGFVGNPVAQPACPMGVFLAPDIVFHCPESTQVGTISCGRLRNPDPFTAGTSQFVERAAV